MRGCVLERLSKWYKQVLRRFSYGEGLSSILKNVFLLSGKVNYSRPQTSRWWWSFSSCFTQTNPLIGSWITCSGSKSATLRRTLWVQHSACRRFNFLNHDSFCVFLFIFHCGVDERRRIWVLVWKFWHCQYFFFFFVSRLLTRAFHWHFYGMFHRNSAYACCMG